MAEPTSSLLNPRTQRRIERVRGLVEKRWPGGVAGHRADYLAGQCTFRQACQQIGVEFRALRAFHDSISIPQRTLSESSTIARHLNPKWNENISRAKMLSPTRHTPDTVLRATTKRTRVLRDDPTRNGNANASMTSREARFAGSLAAIGIEYLFNQTADRYWLDFYLPQLRIGVEIQKSGRVPTRERDRAICETLSLRTVVYIPNTYFFSDCYWYVESLTKTLARDPSSIADAIGDARHLCTKLALADAFWYGFGFTNRWITRRARHPESALAAD